MYLQLRYLASCSLAKNAILCPSLRQLDKQTGCGNLAPATPTKTVGALICSVCAASRLQHSSTYRGGCPEMQCLRSVHSSWTLGANNGRKQGGHQDAWQQRSGGRCANACTQANKCLLAAVLTSPERSVLIHHSSNQSWLTLQI